MLARRMHVLLLVTGMCSKLLQLEKANDSYGHLVETLKKIQSSPFPKKMTSLEETDEYIAYMMAYECFCDNTRAGKHGVNI